MAEDRRGRAAERPSGIPWRGWKDIFRRVWSETSEDNLSIIAAGVAFYGMLALFPGLAALVSIYGLVADPQQVGEQIATLAWMLPADVLNLVEEQLRQITASSETTLGLSLIIGLVVALWSATAGIKALMEALNIVNEEQERRGYLRYYATALGLTLGAIIFVLVAFSLVAVLPAVLPLLLGLFGLSDVAGLVVSLLRWPLLIVFVMFGLAVIYRYGPSREQPRWRWVSVGTVAATLLWLVASVAFSLYVRYFGSYNETYGSVGAVVVLLMWMYLTAYAVLIGGELNAETEHQTAADSTTGRPEPMGRRGARMADEIGRAANEPTPPPRRRSGG